LLIEIKFDIFFAEMRQFEGSAKRRLNRILMTFDRGLQTIAHFCDKTDSRHVANLSLVVAGDARRLLSSDHQPIDLVAPCLAGSARSS
jgi:hypothetical protein